MKQNVKRRALKAAFPHTIPVMAGFLFLGLAYGVLMQSIGCGVLWTFLMSYLVFAGSLQYVALTLLAASFNPMYAFLITLMVNARHIFYGLSMLDKLKGAGRLKPYLIFALCDETFSILCSAQPPEDVDRRWFMFFVAFLNRWYWIVSCLLGSLLGNFVHFNTEGLDFALTALFVVIFLNQWSERKNRAPALIGLAASAVCVLIFGPDRFIIPAMIFILLIFALTGKRLTKNEEEVKSS